MSEQSEEAKQLFWEMVHDFGEYTVHKLAGNDKAPIEAAQVAAVTLTAGHLFMAVVYATEGNWDKVADKCVDMAASAVVNAANFATHGNFGAIKGLVWDLAVAAHVASGHKAPDFAEITKHITHKVGEKSGDKVFEFFHGIAVTGNDRGIADYYARHPEMYRPHVVDGKVHYDRYDLVNGKMLLLHPGFFAQDGQKIFLAPDQKGFQFEGGGPAKVVLEKVEGKEVAKAFKIEVAKPSAPPNAAIGKSLDALLKAIESRPVLPEGAKQLKDSSQKAGKLDGVLKQIESLNKSIDGKLVPQKSDSASKGKLDNIVREIDKSLSSKAVDFSKSQKSDSSSKSSQDSNKALQDSFNKISPSDHP